MSTDQNKNVSPFKITGDWKGQSKLLRSKFAHLTSGDLKLEPGKENDLLKRLSNKLNKNREEVIQILDKTRSESLVQ